MRLIILRHGKAEAHASTGRDEDRLLRPRGEEQARFIADALEASLSPPELILSSGYVRAVQTARILQQALGCTLQIEPALECGVPVGQVVQLINDHRSADETAPPLVLVGHNPQLEDLVALLTRGHTSSPPHPLRTGEAAILDLPDPPADLIGACTLAELLRLDGE